MNWFEICQKLSKEVYKDRVEEDINGWKIVKLTRGGGEEGGEGGKAEVRGQGRKIINTIYITPIRI